MGGVFDNVIRDVIRLFFDDITAVIVGSDYSFRLPAARVRVLRGGGTGDFFHLMGKIILLIRTP